MAGHGKPGLSLSAAGALATGPHRNEFGFGLTIAALTGFQHLTGLPDRQFAGTGTNDPDHILNPCHAAFALLAAVRHRPRTGEGQFIDIAQTEPTTALLGPALLDYSVNGVVQNRRGNAHPDFSPHGVYPARGDDRWIAIAVTTDAQWDALSGVLELTGGEWATTPGRIADRERLDRLVAGRTASWDADALMERLQAAGVPAGAVRDTRDILERDPQLRARGHFLSLQHPKMGVSSYNGPPFTISGSERPVGPAPLLGQRTAEVLADLPGESGEAIAQAAAEGVLQ